MRTLMDEHIKELENVAEPVQMLNIPIISIHRGKLSSDVAGEASQVACEIRQLATRVTITPLFPGWT